MTDATLIADLIRAGLAPDLVGRVANALLQVPWNSMESPLEYRLEKIRERDRERKRNKREFHRNSMESPPDAENALSFLPSSLSNSNKEESKKEEFKKERKHAQKIPPDWRPSELHFASGRKLGFLDEQILEQAEDMRLWALANAHRAVARKLDWDLTFLAWMRRNKPKEAPNGGKSGSLVAAIDKMRAKLASGQNEDFVHVLSDRPVPRPGSVHAPSSNSLGGLRSSGGGDSYIPVDGNPAQVEISPNYRGTG